MVNEICDGDVHGCCHSGFFFVELVGVLLWDTLALLEEKVGEMTGLGHDGAGMDGAVLGTIEAVKLEEDGGVDVYTGVETIPKARTTELAITLCDLVTTWGVVPSKPLPALVYMDGGHG